MWVREDFLSRALHVTGLEEDDEDDDDDDDEDDNDDDDGAPEGGGVYNLVATVPAAMVRVFLSS